MEEKSGWLMAALPYLIPISSLIIGCFFGSYKFFIEQVLRVYEEALPIIRTFAITPPQNRNIESYKTDRWPASFFVAIRIQRSGFGWVPATAEAVGYKLWRLIGR